MSRTFGCTGEHDSNATTRDRNPARKADPSQPPQAYQQYQDRPTIVPRDLGWTPQRPNEFVRSLPMTTVDLSTRPRTTPTRALRGAGILSSFTGVLIALSSKTSFLTTCFTVVLADVMVKVSA